MTPQVWRARTQPNWSRFTFGMCWSVTGKFRRGAFREEPQPALLVAVDPTARVTFGTRHSGTSMTPLGHVLDEERKCPAIDQTSRAQFPLSLHGDTWLPRSNPGLAIFRP